MFRLSFVGMGRLRSSAESHIGGQVRCQFAAVDEAVDSITGRCVICQSVLTSVHGYTVADRSRYLVEPRESHEGGGVRTRRGAAIAAGGLAASTGCGHTWAKLVSSVKSGSTTT